MIYEHDITSTIFLFPYAVHNIPPHSVHYQLPLLPATRRPCVGVKSKAMDSQRVARVPVPYPHVAQMCGWDAWLKLCGSRRMAQIGGVLCVAHAVLCDTSADSATGGYASGSRHGSQAQIAIVSSRHVKVWSPCRVDT